jgi:hypothetical protein
MLKKSLLALTVVGLALAAKPAQAELQWSDNAFQLSYGTTYREPFNTKDIAKTTVTYTHVDGYKWGSNFLNIDGLYSTSGQGDDLQGLNAVPSAGAFEVYVVYRNTLSLNKITGSKTFEIGPVVRDVGIVVGVDVNTKNHAFSSRKIMPIGGVGLSFNVPGFLNLELLANKEWGVNGIAGRSTSFDVTPTIAASWGIPVYGPVSFEGWASVNFPKGNGGITGGDTGTEIHAVPKLMVDVGQLLGSKGYQIGVGFEYWQNKFGSKDGNGTNEDPTGGSFAKTVFGEIAIHL